MTDTTPSPTQEPELVKSDWRVDVLAQANRLRSDAIRLGVAVPDLQRGEIQANIDRARSIAEGAIKTGWFRDFIYGVSVESAWRELQQAQEELLLFRPAEELRAEARYLLRIAVSQNADQEVRTTLESWVSGDPIPDPHLARSIVARAHMETNNSHMAIRHLRNRVMVWALLVAVVDVVLWATGVTQGAIVGLGALGGLLSVVFAVKNADLSAPYNVQLAQGLLKVTTGAGAAILAITILRGGGVSPDAIHLDEYAAVFGFSQQALTQLVDQKAQSLTAQAPPRGSALK